MRSMCMPIWSVFKAGVFPEEKTGLKEREGNNSTRAGLVTHSFLTGDKEELQSKIDLVSLV